MTHLIQYCACTRQAFSVVVSHALLVCGLLIGCFLFTSLILVSARDRDQCSQKSEQPRLTAAAIGFKSI